MRRGSNIFKFIAKLSAIILISILTLELILRIYFYPSHDFLRITEDDPYRWARLPKNADMTIRCKFRMSLMKSILFKYRVRTNSSGLRADRDYKQNPSVPVLRIICLGDSITFGWNLEYEYTYPYLLEKQINALNPNFHTEVINSAFPSYTTRQGLIWLDRELLSLQPDIIILQFGFNDSLPSWERMSGPVRLGTDSQVMQGKPGNWIPIKSPRIFDPTGLVNKTILGRVVMLVWTMTAYPKKPEKKAFQNTPDYSYQRSRVPIPDFRSNILEIHRLCKEQNIRLILIDAWGTPEDYRNELYRIAEEKNIELFSQARLIENSLRNLDSIISQPKYKPFLANVQNRFDKNFLEKNKLFYLAIDWLHPSELGNIIFAEKLAEFILKEKSAQ